MTPLLALLEIVALLYTHSVQYSTHIMYILLILYAYIYGDSYVFKKKKILLEGGGGGATFSVVAMPTKNKTKPQSALRKKLFSSIVFFSSVFVAVVV